MCHYSEWLQKRLLVSTAWWSFILLDHIQSWAWQIPLYSHAFGVTVAGDIIQHKLDESFGKTEQVIIIADDIIIVGYKSDHSVHDQAFTTLPQTAKRCNVKLNYDKLQYKQNEDEFSRWKLYNKQSQVK